MNKSQIRVRFLKRRERLSSRVKSEKDKKIIDRLIKFPLFRASPEFFTYISHRGEVSTDMLIEKFFGKKKIVVPKIKAYAICLYELHHPKEFKRGKFGIREPKFCLPRPSLSEATSLLRPKGATLQAWSEIDVALIPAIAFDKGGHRIGFGGGYFDRLLKKLRCTTIGLSYEFQIIDKVETHAYDVPVDYIVTENRIIRCQQFRSKIRKSTKSSKQK